ncbi:MAG TPA: hypothetical protein VNU46_05145 [Gemmatimonadaceae bacterium]|jgi:hypothetical protein|nr:hypothetical protein [Gemmatimonadaceae bacterium]
MMPQSHASRRHMERAGHIGVALRMGVICALAMTIGVSQSQAQNPSLAKVMDGRVSPALRVHVMVLVDSVMAAGLPGAPLVDKALEGASKGATDARILVAVRNVAAGLGQARLALGMVSDDELTAAAAALRAGVPAKALGEMRRSLAGRSLVVPLSVLSALVVQGVTPPAAAAAVVAYAKRNDDGQMLAYGQDIVREIAEGVSPQIAISSAVSLEGQASSPAPSYSKPKP